MCKASVRRLAKILHYDVSGQLLNRFVSWITKCLIAADIPPIRLATVTVANKGQSTWAKGVGEAGTVGALAAVYERC